VGEENWKIHSKGEKKDIDESVSRWGVGGSSERRWFPISRKKKKKGQSSIKGNLRGRAGEQKGESRLLFTGKGFTGCLLRSRRERSTILGMEKERKTTRRRKRK